MNEEKNERMDCACCSHRTKMRTPEELADLNRRLNRIEGQIKGIRGMLEKNAYCPDILMQVSAAGAALNSFTKVLLASHIRSCVAQHVRQGDDSVIDELVETLQRLMK
ncbi:MAG: metal-sensing transcriptional repressor [Sphaerochaetaceae bacterium]|nr:metal-sensing transcriptional repressor [Spirochaetales bacterium]MDY5499347.1 metal-sensing transcriptional repressor [Sphaerochaetaceae bacterium]